MELIQPSLDFESAFAEFYDDFAKNDVENAEFYSVGKEHFASYVQGLIDEAHGVNLQEGYVPCSHFWLVNNESEILGAIRVRHNIENEFLAVEAGHIGYDIVPSFRNKGHGKAMLKLALVKAKELGIKQALVTADEDNIASRKVIEGNGGKLENIVMGRIFPNPIARYWVDCE